MNKNKSSKVLFICKKRLDSYGVSFGLLNSATFVSNFLNNNGIESKVVMVVDNNGIDREVKQFNPTHVFIEALWVVPEKFHILLKLYPSVKWIIRIHSQIPFIANEGIAVKWIYGYLKISKKYKNLFLSFNSDNCSEDFSKIGIENIYLPNIYETKIGDVKEQDYTSPCFFECFSEIYSWMYQKKPRIIKPNINIGCFGAIRPMKNHLAQAFAAIAFCNKMDMRLKFHINSNRIEQKGEEVLKNIRYLFENSQNHSLVEHKWMSHDKFIKLIKTMDLGMQVSFSETFNIVTADFVWNEIPVVVSPEMTWLPDQVKASPTSIDSIIDVMENYFKSENKNLEKKNKKYLIRHNEKSGDIWLEYFSRTC